MNTLVPNEPRATAAEVQDDFLVIWLDDGRMISVPLAWFPRLAEASRAAANNLQIVGRGIGLHWPDLDEDLSIRGLVMPLDERRRTPEAQRELSPPDIEVGEPYLRRVQ